MMIHWMKLLIFELAARGCAVAAVSARCGNSSSVGFSLQLNSAQPVLRFDVHVSAADDGAVVRSVTTTGRRPWVRVEDLWPGRKYHVSVRTQSLLGANRSTWSALSPSIGCTTRPLAQTQAHLLPPTGAPTTTSVVVRIGGCEIADPSSVVGWKLQWRRVQSIGPWVTAPKSPANKRSVRLTGLPAGSALEVRATALIHAGRARGASAVRSGVPSDSVVHYTSDLTAEPLSLLRMSELCGDACDIDFLTNHDSGSAEGDQLFATLMASMPPGPSNPMGIAFNSSVTTRYCTHRDVRQPFAQYASCDGARGATDTDNYVCVCSDMADHCFARAPCDDPVPNPRTGAPQCKASCSASTLAASLRSIGRMPVYLPMFEMPNVMPIPLDWKCPAPPVNKSTFVGYWYSTPVGGQCDDGVRTFPKEDGDRDGCTWSRGVEQVFVKGWALLTAGFNVSTRLNGAQMKQNAQVMRGLFDKLSPRCCGC
eukprot:COSAG05_NODE_382_length_10509_cov_8.360519_6_plen_481_part_00